MIANDDNIVSYEIMQKRIEEAKQYASLQEKDLQSLNDDNYTCIDYLNIKNICDYLSTDKNKIPRKYFRIYYIDYNKETEYNIITNTIQEAINTFRKTNKNKINSIQLCELKDKDLANIVKFAKQWADQKDRVFEDCVTRAFREDK